MADIWYIQVNRYCNNSCHFCSNPSNWTDITLERWYELIDEFVGRWYDWIIFTWWEPTLSKNLWKWISYANKKWISSRIISNWSIASDYEYLKWLKENWLRLMHLSVYSHISKIHDFLTCVPGSYRKLLDAINNAWKLWIEVQINTVINHYNQDHLDKIVLFLDKNFPFIRHFVWNNLDPKMMKQTKIAMTTLPDFDIFSKSLNKAMKYLSSKSKTFRAERIPLCYMRWFEFASTETRKIVKNEQRLIYFLDSREVINHIWADFEHDKSELCKKCELTSICAWIYEIDTYYDYVKLLPQKVTMEERKIIIDKIKWEW